MLKGISHRLPSGPRRGAVAVNLFLLYLVTLYLSDVPLTTRLIDSFSVLREMAAAGRLHLLSLRIHLPSREVTGIEVLHPALPDRRLFLYKGNLGAYNFTVLTYDRVEGTARTTGTLTGDGAGIAFDIGFTAVPAVWEQRSWIDGLIHRYPAVGKLLEIFARPVGWMADHIAVLFFGLVALILLWIFVIIPRRHARSAWTVKSSLHLLNLFQNRPLDFFRFCAFVSSFMVVAGAKVFTIRGYLGDVQFRKSYFDQGLERRLLISLIQQIISMIMPIAIKMYPII